MRQVTLLQNLNNSRVLYSKFKRTSTQGALKLDMAAVTSGGPVSSFLAGFTTIEHKP